MKSRLSLTLAVATLAVGTLLSSPARAQATYSYRDLGTLGGTFSTALDVNDQGQVVGCSFRSGGTSFGRDERAFYWAGGVMTDIGTLGGTWSVASAINNAGEVVGRSQVTVPVGNARAFLWNRVTGGPLINLNSLLSAADAANWVLTEANGINNNRQVVGSGEVLIGGIVSVHGYLLDLNTGLLTDLGTLGGSSSYAYGLNDLGFPQVVGNSSVGGVNAGYLYNGLSPLVSLFPLTSARDINNAGEIAGRVEGKYAAYRSAVGAITNLGTFSGFGSFITSEAFDINNATTAMVVGSADMVQSSWILPRAFRWQVGGGAIVKLNDLTPNRGTGKNEWHLLRATSISNNGFIACTAGKGNVSVTNRNNHAFLLMPQ